MKSFKYVGPHAEVEIPALGAVVASGGTVEVPDAEASGFQGQSVWELVPPKKQPVVKADEKKDED